MSKCPPLSCQRQSPSLPAFGHKAPQPRARNTAEAEDAQPRPTPFPQRGSGTAAGSSSSFICFCACLLPRPHVFSSYQRQELGTGRPKQTTFPRTGPGGGGQERREACLRLPVSKRPGPTRPGKGAGAGLQRENPTAAPVPVGSGHQGTETAQETQGKGHTTDPQQWLLSPLAAACAPLGLQSRAHPAPASTPHGPALTPQPVGGHPDACRAASDSAGRHKRGPTVLTPVTHRGPAAEAALPPRGAGQSFKHPPPPKSYIPSTDY